MACGPKPGIKRFEVDPPCVCRGHQVLVAWSVIGTPEITYDNAPRDWPANKTLESCDWRHVHVDKTTNFTLKVPDANPADGHGVMPQEVKVVDDKVPAHVSTPQCTDQMVWGNLPAVSSCGAPVLLMRDPVVQGPGAANRARKVCLVPPGADPICVDAGGSQSVGKVLGEGWKIQVPLEPGESCDPGKKPGLATVQLELDCEQTR